MWVCLHHIWAGTVLAEKGCREKVQVGSLLPDEGEGSSWLEVKVQTKVKVKGRRRGCPSLLRLV